MQIQRVQSRPFTPLQKLLFIALIVGAPAGIWWWVHPPTQAGTTIGALTAATSTSFTCGTSNVTDVDGNVYNTVLIGEQCWMKQSMRVGTMVNATTTQTNNSTIEKWCYNNDIANCMTNNHPNYPDGGLYQWNEAMQYSTTPGARGICPVGWHIPTHDEFTTLERAVCTSATCVADFPYDTVTTGFRGTDEGTKLKPNGSTGWEGNQAGDGNAGSFGWRETNGDFWTSNQSGSNAWYRDLETPGTRVFRLTYPKTWGWSVRCLRDSSNSPETLPPSAAISQTLTNSTLDSGLVGHWTFDGPDVDWGSSTAEINDTSGKSNHGNAQGGMSPATSPIIGVMGQAMRFRTDSELINAGSASVLDNLPRMTITTWVKPLPSSDPYGLIISKALSEASGSGSWKLSSTLDFKSSHTVPGWWISENLPINEWSFVAITYDNTSTANDPVFYVNGRNASVAEFTPPSGAVVSDATKSVVIGNTINADRAFPGAIDDVRIYNRALSPDEVKRLYELGTPTRIATTPTNPALDSGLVGHWTFDGPDVDWGSTTAEIRDTSGKGNHGNTQGGMSPATSPTIGSLGQGMNFDGVNDYVLISDKPELRPGSSSWSISLWANPANNATSKTFVGKRLNSIPYSNYKLGVADGNCETPGSGKKVSFAYIDDAASAARCIYTTNDVVDGSWHHLVGVADKNADILYIFVDGVRQSTDTYLNVGAWPNITNTDYLGIGRQNGSTAYYGDAIDDVRIYNRALSAEEVKRLYEMGK